MVVLTVVQPNDWDCFLVDRLARSATELSASAQVPHRPVRSDGEPSRIRRTFSHRVILSIPTLAGANCVI